MEVIELIYCLIILVVPLMGIVGMAIFQLLCRLLLNRRKVSPFTTHMDRRRIV